MHAPWFILVFSVLFIDAAVRLKINGSSLIRPDNTPIRLTGFNWEAIVHKPTPLDGDFMAKSLPGANVARILWPWGNFHPFNNTMNITSIKLVDDFCSSNVHGQMPDCMMSTPPYFQDACFSCIDYAIEQAISGKSEVWVVLATRGEFIAGQCSTTPPGNGCPATDLNGNVFENPKLAAKFYIALSHVAAHYKNVDYIAAVSNIFATMFSNETYYFTLSSIFWKYSMSHFLSRE
jgi:hypothetical protein